MNFEQNVNDLVNSLGILKEGKIISYNDRTDDINRMADETNGSRPVRRRYKRELLKRIQYALWAAQRKIKVSAFPEGRYVPFQARPNKY